LEKGRSWNEVTSNSKRIRPVALSIVELWAEVLVHNQTEVAVNNTSWLTKGFGAIGACQKAKLRFEAYTTECQYASFRF